MARESGGARTCRDEDARRNRASGQDDSERSWVNPAGSVRGGPEHRRREAEERKREAKYSHLVRYTSATGRMSRSGGRARPLA